MYPDLSYFLHDVFGTQPDNASSIIKTFGFFLVLAILSAAVMLASELKRKEEQGLLKSNIITQTIGEPLKIQELISKIVLGFILGFKFLYIFFNFEEFKIDPAGVIFSGQGNWIGGILLAAIFAATLWYEKKREALDKPIVQKIEVHPYQRIGDITIVAALSGVLGAKLFAMIEDLDLVFNGTLTFGQWLSSLLSGSGLAIYGGLIGGFIVTYFYLKRNKITPIHTMDAVAPALMIAYGIGRMGCHFSGDGDWGIPIGTLAENGEIIYEYSKPAFLSIFPDWVWAYDYPHNVSQQGVRMADCNWIYCSKLPVPVFSTPIYEIVMAFILGGILWALRKRITIPGMLFFIYLIFNGFERFWIEKIRVNEVYDFMGIPTTQAELIATLLMIIGVIGCVVLLWRNKREAELKV